MKPIEETELTLEETKLNKLYEYPTFYSTPGMMFSENYQVLFPVDRDLATKVFAAYLKVPDHDIVYGLHPKVDVPAFSIVKDVNNNNVQ